MEQLPEGLKFISGLSPRADIYNGGQASKVIDMSKYRRVVFGLLQVTAGTDTGTATVTLQACDNGTPSNTTAIPFDYWKNESAGTVDTLAAKVRATAAGFTTTANKTALYLIEVKAEELPAGTYGVRLKTTEVVNDPVTGAIFVVAAEPRFEGIAENAPTALLA